MVALVGALSMFLFLGKVFITVFDQFGRKQAFQRFKFDSFDSFPVQNTFSLSTSDTIR